MWVYFRSGHGTYLVYTTALTNFILIFYRLLVEQVSFFNAIFTSLTMFVLVFLFLYIPVAIIVGRWHFKTQLETDFVEQTKYNPPLLKIIENQEKIIKYLKIDAEKND